MKEFFVGLFKWIIVIGIILAVAWFGWKIPPQQFPIVVKDKIVAFSKGVATGFSDFLTSTEKLKNVGETRFKEAQDVYNKTEPKDPIANLPID